MIDYLFLTPLLPWEKGFGDEAKRINEKTEGGMRKLLWEESLRCFCILI
jgi:hypothetical protein